MQNDLSNESLATLTRLSLVVHIHWASHARDPWSHATLHRFKGNQQCGMLMCIVFFHHIMIVFVRNYYNTVKKYCIHKYTTLMVTLETVNPYMRSRISCMRCSVYVFFFYYWQIWTVKPLYKLISYWKLDHVHPNRSPNIKFYLNPFLRKLISSKRVFEGN